MNWKKINQYARSTCLFPSEIRKLEGYDLVYEISRLVDLMNDLYRNEWSQLNNFFCPSMKLKSKVKINSRYQRKYFKSTSPYHRLLGSEAITPEKKQALKEQFEQLNPFELRAKIEEKLKVIFSKVKLHKSPRKKI